MRAPGGVRRGQIDGPAAVRLKIGRRVNPDHLELDSVAVDMHDDVVVRVLPRVHDAAYGEMPPGSAQLAEEFPHALLRRLRSTKRPIKN